MNAFTICSLLLFLLLFVPHPAPIITTQSMFSHGYCFPANYTYLWQLSAPMPLTNTGARSQERLGSFLKASRSTNHTHPQSCTCNSAPSTISRIFPIHSRPRCLMYLFAMQYLRSCCKQASHSCRISLNSHENNRYNPTQTCPKENNAYPTGQTKPSGATGKSDSSFKLGL